jgi:DNA polymerase III subunit epsilon
MIAIDTETTGLLRPGATELHLQPFVIEICALKFDKDFKVTDEFTTFVKPPVPIPDEIIKITGIDNSMVQKAPSFVSIYDDLCNFFLGENVMFAHNCAFDVGILLHELQRIGFQYKFPWPPKQICTVEASYSIKNKRLRLGDLYEIATGKKEIENAHRAKSDVLAMVECIKFLSENNFI